MVGTDQQALARVIGHTRPRRVPVTAGLDASAIQTAADLRRLRKREVVESIVARAENLLPSDRELLHLLYRDGKKIADVAALLCVDKRRVRRRVKQLVRLVLSPTFVRITFLWAQWPESRREVARHVFLCGRTMRETARALGMSLHCVRKQVEIVRIIVEEQV